MYKSAIYIISVLLSVFALSGINFNDFFKKDHVWEARIFIVVVSFALGYLLASFLISFMEVSRII